MMHQFIKNRDFVLFSFMSWESDIGFNLKDMAYELAKHNRVLFVDRAKDRKSQLGQNGYDKKKSGLTAKTNKLEKIQDNFWILYPQSILESINWLPSFKLYDYFNRLNNKKLGREINDALAVLEFSELIFINDNDFFRGFYLMDLVPCQKYIFYIRDYLTIQPYFKKYGVYYEREMMQKAHMVVANSSFLAEYANQWNKASYYIGQGCDLESFMVPELSLPEDLKSIPHPIIGYAGFLTGMRLDINVIEHIAISLPNCSIVLVGPADSDFDNSRLHQLSNIFFLGSKAPESIQHYVRHFDICINPQIVNLLTMGNYPRKIDEYLATGKPVVATETKAMDMFKEFTFLCHSKEDFVEKIQKILGDQQIMSAEEGERRIKFAMEHSWQNCIGSLGDAYYQSESSKYSVYGRTEA
ncbi:MAG: glycosyltransferase [Chitinophagales bacterium]